MILAAVFGPIPGTVSSCPAAAASRSSGERADTRAHDRARASASARARAARPTPTSSGQRLRLELAQLGELARLDELLQARLDPGPDPGSSRARPARTSVGDVAGCRADQLGRAPVGAHGVVARPGEVEQRCEALRAARRGRRSSTLESLPMAQIVVPFRGEIGKRRLAPRTPCGSQLALAMLGDVLAACVATGTTFVVTDDADARELADELGAEAVADPGGGQGAAVAAGARAGRHGAVLVVNADVPCVVPHDLRTLAGSAELGAVGLVEAADGTTNALALPARCTFAPLYGRGQRRALSQALRGTGCDRGRGRDPEPRRRRRHDGRSAAARPARGPAHASCDGPGSRRMKVALLSGGVGGARFARGLVSAVRSGGRHRGRQRRRRPRGARPAVSPDLDSILYALAGLHDEERGWGRAGETWHALETVARARRRGLVPARRPRPRPPPRADAGAARGRAALGRDEPARAARSASRLRSSRRPTTGCAPGSTLRPGSFPFQEWFVARGHRDEVDAVRFVGEAARRRRASSRRSPQPTRS